MSRLDPNVALAVAHSRHRVPMFACPECMRRTPGAVFERRLRALRAR